MAALVLISSLSISVFAEEDQMVDEGNGEYDERGLRNIYESF